MVGIFRRRNMSEKRWAQYNMRLFHEETGDISLAGAFASYYWAKNKPKDVPSFPVLRALGRALRYNLGSLAFGSLIIAVIKLIRVLLDYLDKKLSTTNSTILKSTEMLFLVSRSLLQIPYEERLHYVEDSEQNDGSAEKPYYMSKNLQRILDIKNEK
ncbi:hypothetical protein TELCIR_16016 [Teladorsagia circumcincta]|uniref:Choline transporter-like protein n=1 Tax=Teladorsagia circumcincta TaxID=45464 RepID=A0A2G9TYA9_TELCI|nr:hypothetical protein TELCIR_16016 [Teladorsagia circumcincta]